MPGSTTSSSGELLEQLSRNSTPYQDPLSRVAWDQLDGERFWLPEPAISLYGLPEYERLPQAQRRRLSQLEFVNFITAGLWLEGIFMHRISRTLLGPVTGAERRAYELHELREEAGHSLMFLELIRRAEVTPPRRFWRVNLANALGRYAPFNSTAFWVAVLIGEEVPDRLNRYLRKHREAVAPAVYDMATVHVMDEARHIAHARQILSERLPRMPGWQRLLLRPMLQVVFRQFVQVFYFPGPEIYEEAGLTPGHRWARRATRNAHRIAFVDETLQSALGVLRDQGLALRWH